MIETLRTSPLEIIRTKGNEALLWFVNLQLISQIINILGSSKKFVDDNNFLLVDKNTGENIGQGWQKTGAPSGNTISQSLFDKDTTLLQTFRQKIKNNL